MIPRPDEPTLLRAVARLLEADVRPQVQDRSLSFRLRIAAHLLASTADHLTAGEALEQEALAALATVLETDVPAGPRRDALLDLERELSQRLQAGTVDRDTSLAWLKQVLTAQLALTSPRFDPRPDIEQG